MNKFVFLLLVCVYCVPEHTILQHNIAFGPVRTKCNTYEYFSIDTSAFPCQDVIISVKHDQGQPDLYVGKDPVRYPTLDHLTWTSYEWGDELLTISHWDPEYEPGILYIGVLAYCGEDVHTGDEDAIFNITVNLDTSSHSGAHYELDILDSPQLNRELGANAYHYYHFCLPFDCADVTVDLVNCIDPNECPNAYAWPELLVSRSLPQPTIKDHSWKLAQIDRRHVFLSHTDPDVKAGHYFVGVYGWCTPEEECPDKSSCGPCDYARSSLYNLTVKAEQTGGAK